MFLIELIRGMEIISSLPGIAECTSFLVPSAKFSGLPCCCSASWRLIFAWWLGCLTGAYFWVFKVLISSANNADCFFSYWSLSFTILISMLKLYLYAFITSLCTCLIACKSCPTFCIIIRFHISIFLFSTWNFWVAICFRVASAVLLVLIVLCISCLILNRFVTFLLVGLKIPISINWVLAASSSSSIWQTICRLWYDTSCSSPFTVSTVASFYASYASFSTSLYLSILQHLSISGLPEITSKLAQDDIKFVSTVHYTIKNSQWPVYDDQYIKFFLINIYFYYNI